MAIPSIDSFGLLFKGLWYSRLFWAALIAWLGAELIKLALLYKEKGTISFKEFMNSGGMPSTHSSAITSVAVSIFFEQGVSALFILAGVVAFIIMYDAQNVRYEVQKHAKILDEITKKDKNKTSLKLRVGHTKTQVLAGATLGIIIATIIYLI